MVISAESRIFFFDFVNAAVGAVQPVTDYFVMPNVVSALAIDLCTH